MGKVPGTKIRAKLSKYIGSWEVSISASIKAPYTKYFWRFLRHIRTFLDYLGGVDLPVGRVPVPKIWAKLSLYMGSGEVNISASIKALCTKSFLEVPETNRNISTPHAGCLHTHDEPRSTQNTHITFKQFSHGSNHHSINSFHIHMIE